MWHINLLVSGFDVASRETLFHDMKTAKGKRLDLIQQRAGIVQLARFGLIHGGFGVTFPSIALFWVAHYLPAGVVAIAFTLVGVARGMILFGELHSIYIWVALVLTLVGIIVVRPRIHSRLV